MPESAPRRSRDPLPRALLVALATLLAVAATLGAGPVAPAVAASTCGGAGLQVTALQSDDFYIDTAVSYLGSYVGYRIADTSGAPRSDLWMRLEAFTGGVVAPATGGATTHPRPLDALPAGGGTPAYAYLKATGATTADQTHDVVVFQGRPGAGGSELCRETQRVDTVDDVIKAAANKITGGSMTGTPKLGGTFSVTVQGDTGTIGAGPPNDLGIIRFSPAVAADWPATAFRLVNVSHRLPLPGAAPVDGLLSRNGMDTFGRADYGVTYTFRVVGTTSGPTELVPVQNIASGTQVKHTDPGTLSTLAKIPAVTSDARMAVAVTSGGAHVPGDVVPVEATIVNDGSGPVAVDEVVVRVPSGWTVAPGTTRVDGTPVADPFVDAEGRVHVVGPITAPATGSARVTLDLVAGPSARSGDVVVAGTLPGATLDATKAVGDDVPARATLVVAGSSGAVDDTAAVAHGATTSIDVLANDVVSGGTPALAVTTAPQHGTATVSDGRIDYTPAAGFAGADTFGYTFTTSSGSASADVAVTVAPPAAPSPADRSSSGTGVDLQHVALAVPTGGAVRLVAPGGARVTRLTVPGGVFELDPATGVVTFTPALGVTGTAEVGFVVTDAYGQDGTARLRATVTAPAGPAAHVRTSGGVGTATQGADLPVPAGGSATLLDAGGAPVASRTLAGQGAVVLDAATGRVTFTPVLGFSGTATAVPYRVTDAYGQSASSTYTPSVTPPPAPLAPARASSATAPAEQQATLPVPPGGSVRLLDAAGVPATRVAVAGQGVFELDPATGVVRFSPEPRFTGAPRPVGYRTTDAYGQTSNGAYAPEVLAPPAPTAPDEHSTGAPAQTQERTVAVPPGGSLTLVGPDGRDTDRVEMPDQGVYALARQRSAIAFSPRPGFTGAPRAVRFRVADAYGQSVEASYQPTVEAPTPPPAAAPTCASRRTMTLHWWVARSVRLSSITVLVDGERVARLRGAARSVEVDLKGRPRQTSVVRILGHVRGGGRVATTRTYRPCRSRLAQPPLRTLQLLPVRRGGGA